MNTITVGNSLKILQLNIEGISKSKSEVLSRIANENEVHVILLQETHTRSDEDLNNRGSLHGYKLVAALHSPVHGIATYVAEDLFDYKLIHMDQSGNLFIIGIEIAGTKVINVYKPPSINWPSTVMINFAHPCFIGGDLNTAHDSWGYRNNTTEGEILAEWLQSCDYHILYDSKDKPSFHSARWQTGTNPDLSLISSALSSYACRLVLPNFPHSQHRPIITTIGIQIPLTHSAQKPRWNFQKANWEQFSHELDHVIQYIPVAITNYD